MAAKARQAADDALVVGKVAVAVQLNEAGEQALDVVQRVGAVGVTGDFGDLPGREAAVDVLGELDSLDRKSVV